MYKLTFTFFLCLFTLSVFGQSFSYGVKAGYITYHRMYGNTLVEGTQVRNSTSSSGFMDGWRLAGLTRMEYKRWLAQAELAYGNNIGGNGTVIVIDNTQNPANSASADSWLIGQMPLLKNIEFSLTGGYKPLKWLRLSAGLGVWHQRPKQKPQLVLYDENTGVAEVTRAKNEMNRFMYGVETSYLPWVLTRQVGIGIDVKKNFSLDIAYERSLTPASKTLEYKGQNYVFRQQTERFVVSLAYRFYQFKQGKPIIKKR